MHDLNFLILLIEFKKLYRNSEIVNLIKFRLQVQTIMQEKQIYSLMK